MPKTTTRVQTHKSSSRHYFAPLPREFRLIKSHVAHSTNSITSSTRSPIMFYSCTRALLFSIPIKISNQSARIHLARVNPLHHIYYILYTYTATRSRNRPERAQIALRIRAQTHTHSSPPFPSLAHYYHKRRRRRRRRPSGEAAAAAI